jgi:TnpA family transposase
VDGKDKLLWTRLEKLEEPPSLPLRREQTSAMMPKVDLPEVLLEMNTRTGFAEAFTHIGEGNTRLPDLPVSICAVLLAEACNLSLESLVDKDVPALTRDRLSYVQQNYIRFDTLTAANARLVDYQATLPLAQVWGGGDVASVDGLRFVVPIRTVNAGPNPKYFGIGRGITYINMVSDQFTGLHGVVVPGTLRDSLHILDGLLEQQTSLEPVEVIADTAGYSDPVFGLFWLLGYQFSPALADLSDMRLWRLHKQADYGTLNAIARNRVNLKLIEENWQDFLRVAGSLKLGTVRASDFMRTLIKGDRPASSLQRALGELGKIPKTLFMLALITDEGYRRRILLQRNRHEGRHRLARAMFYGGQGQVRKAYREGQEDQLGALGLVLNVITLFNTIYLGKAVAELGQRGEVVSLEDISRLTPLLHAHINFLGRYRFVLPKEVENGGLRPLREPNIR